MTDLSLHDRPSDPTRQLSRRLVPDKPAAAVIWWPEAAALSAVMFIAVVLPLPFGGVQAASWMGFSAVSGGIALAYARTATRTAPTRPDAYLAIAATLAALAIASALRAAWAYVPVLPGLRIAAPADAAIAAIRLAGLGLIAATCGMALTACADPFRAARRMCLCLFAAILGYAAFALATETIGTGPGAGLRGPFANRNSFATFLGMGTLIGLALVMLPERQYQTREVHTLRLVSMWVALATIVAALLVTQSRLGVLSTLCGAAVLIALEARRGWPPILLYSLVFLAGAALIWGQPTLDRFSVLGEDWETRRSFYAQILGMIVDRPLLGHGADGFALAFEAYHRPPVDIGFVWDRTHSTYLKLWSELGLLFGSLPLIATGLFLARKARVLAQPHFRFAPLATACLVQVGTHSLFDFSIEVLANQVLFVLLLGLATIPARTPKPKGYTYEHGHIRAVL